MSLRIEYPMMYVKILTRKYGHGGSREGACMTSDPIKTRINFAETNHNDRTKIKTWMWLPHDVGGVANKHHLLLLRHLPHRYGLLLTADLLLHFHTHIIRCLPHRDFLLNFFHLVVAWFQHLFHHLAVVVVVIVTKDCDVLSLITSLRNPSCNERRQTLAVEKLAVCYCHHIRMWWSWHSPVDGRWCWKHQGTLQYIPVERTTTAL